MAVQIGPVLIGFALGLVVMLAVAWFANERRRGRRGDARDANGDARTSSSSSASATGVRGDEKVMQYYPPTGTCTPNSSPATQASARSPLNEDAFRLKERRKEELRRKSLERYMKLHPELAM